MLLKHKKINNKYKLLNSRWNLSCRTAALVVVLALLPVPAIALTGQIGQTTSGGQFVTETSKNLNNLPAFRFTDPQARLFSGDERIAISPFGRSHSGWSLVGNEAQDLMRGTIDISTYLKRKAINLLGTIPLGLAETAIDPNTRRFEYQAEGVALCQYQVKAHQFANGEFIVMGSVPQVLSGSTVSPQDWPTLDETVLETTILLQSQVGGEVVGTPRSPVRCYIVVDGSLVPAWKFYIDRKHGSTDDIAMPELVIANPQAIYEHSPAYFDVSGKALVYPFNPVKTPTMVDTEIKNLVGDGYLTTDTLTTTASAPNKRAKAADNVFNFNVGSAEFGEVSSFVNASKHLAFLQDLGFEWYGPKPLKVSTSVAGLTNNARFVPSFSEGTSGQVDIGAGDGAVLKGLELDSDVVSHEVGHFVVYRSITKTTGESLVLHEGLADYFTFARSNDACLGESICPAGGQACIKPGACLRSGDNSYKVDDSLWKQWGQGKGLLTHLHSQVISGMLWSLREKEIPGNILDKMVIAAIGYLPNDADFSNFLLGLANADKALAAGAYYPKIEAAAKERNLGNRLPAVSETGSFSKNTAKDSTTGTVTKEQASGQTEPGATPVPGKTTTRSGGGGGPCGVIEGRSQQDTGLKINASYALLLVLPLGLVFVKRRRECRN